MNKQLRLAAALPLIGLNAAWVIFMVAAWFEHKENLVLNFDGPQSLPEVKASTYSYLAAIAVFSIVASIAHRLSDTQDATGGDTDKAAHAVLRFASLAVIVGLVAGAVFALGTFLSSFQNYTNTPVTLTGRLLGVYLPIILATGLVVFVLLRVTVYRKSAANNHDASGKPNPQQRAMVLGYTLPIVATALAIILGMAFWDFQGQNLDNWVWVVILAIVAAGLIFGTRFAVAAKPAKPAPLRPRLTGAGAAGAITLNYVLAVIFGAVVTVMSFTLGASSFSAIDNGSQTRTTNWISDLLLPAYVMLVLVTLAVYVTLVTRHKQASTKAE